MPSASEHTTARLRSLIVLGSLAPGSRLHEAELAKQLGVSRTPVREALRVLSVQGLVEILPNRGARVVQYSVAELEDTYELRALLESYAVRRATERISATDLLELDGFCDRMELCADNCDFAELSQLNARYHECIVVAAASSQLERMLSFVMHFPLVMRAFARYSPEALARSMSHHREIIAAMRAGAPEWGAAVMTAHINSARCALVEELPGPPEGEGDIVAPAPQPRQRLRAAKSPNMSTPK